MKRKPARRRLKTVKSSRISSPSDTHIIEISADSPYVTNTYHGDAEVGIFSASSLPSYRPERGRPPKDAQFQRIRSCKREKVSLTATAERIYPGTPIATAKDNLKKFLKRRGTSWERL